MKTKANNPLIFLNYLNKDIKITSVNTVILMFFSAILETLSIGIVIPLISIFIDPNLLLDSLVISKISSILNFDLHRITVSQIIISFLIVIILATIFKIIILKRSMYLAKMIVAEIGSKVFEKIIFRPYEEQLYYKSHSVISSMTHKLDSLSSFIFHLLVVLSAILVFLTIFITISLFNISIVIYVIVPILIFYICIGVLTKKILDKNSNLLNQSMNSRLKTMQDAFGSMRDILLNFAQKNFTKIFSNIELNYRKSEAKVAFLSAFPRHVLEGVAILFLTIIAFVLFKLDKNSSEILLVIGTLVFATQRLLPFFQQMYNSWSNFYGHQHVIMSVIELINIKQDDKFLRNKGEKFFFKEKIEFKNISYTYPKAESFAIKNFSSEIKRGDKIAIIGKTGSGKSTLIDLIIGFLKASEGDIVIDDKSLKEINLASWIENISHVPQDIFLVNDTIKNNINFHGQNSHTENEINIAAKIAEVLEFSDRKHDKINFLVGDNGKNLSGGQKQRIGLARAFLRNRKILILDEATNQLDKFTEKKIYENILKNFKDITLIVITHKETNLDFFSKIINLNDLNLIDSNN